MYKNTVTTTEMVKGAVLEDFAVLGQFFAKIIALRLHS